MYHVYFRLPGGIDPLQRKTVRSIAIRMINMELAAWKKEYGIPYKTREIDSRLCVSFALEQDIVFFRLSWQPKTYSTSFDRMEFDITS